MVHLDTCTSPHPSIRHPPHRCTCATCADFHTHTTDHTPPRIPSARTLARRLSHSSRLCSRPFSPRTANPIPIPVSIPPFSASDVRRATHGIDVRVHVHVHVHVHVMGWDGMGW